MRFAVETWAPEYGVAADAAELEPTAGDVDVTVERKAEEWAPIAPGDVLAPESMIFIDGVRRFDARIWIGGDDGEVVRPGVCASVAAGAVRCVGDSAEVVAAEVRRGVFATAGNGAGPIGTEHGHYELYPVADDSERGPLPRGARADDRAGDRADRRPTSTSPCSTARCGGGTTPRGRLREDPARAVSARRAAADRLRARPG